jgi:hypothetical protein
MPEVDTPIRLFRLHVGPMTAILMSDGIWTSEFPGFSAMLNAAYPPSRFIDVRWDSFRKAAEQAAEILEGELETLTVRQRPKGAVLASGKVVVVVH